MFLERRVNSVKASRVKVGDVYNNSNFSITILGAMRNKIIFKFPIINRTVTLTDREFENFARDYHLKLVKRELAERWD